MPRVKDRQIQTAITKLKFEINSDLVTLKTSQQSRARIVSDQLTRLELTVAKVERAKSVDAVREHALAAIKQSLWIANGLGDLWHSRTRVARGKHKNRRVRASKNSAAIAERRRNQHPIWRFHAAEIWARHPNIYISANTVAAWIVKDGKALTIKAPGDDGKTLKPATVSAVRKVIAADNPKKARAK